MKNNNNKRAARASACAIAALMVIGSAGAAEPVIEYTVLQHDTLIGLSRDLLIEPRRWRAVASFNRLANPHLILPGQVLRIPAALMRSVPLTARIVSSEGDVRLGGASAPAGTPIAGDQAVVTGDDGLAVVELADGSRVRVESASEAALSEHLRYATRKKPDPAAAATAAPAEDDEGWFAGAMRLVKGSVEVLATKVLRAKPLEVKAPTAVVGVRGTEFRVRIEASDLVSAETLEGRVSARPTSGAAEITIEGGFGAAIGASGEARLSPLLAAPDLQAMPARFERPLVRFAVPGEARTLRVQVAADPRFERVMSDQRIEAGSDVRIAGLPDGTWYLRARRIDDTGLQGRDAARSFVLKARPEPPAIGTPRPGAKLTAGEVSLTWAENLEAASYAVEVGRDAGFAPAVVSMQATGPGTRVRLDEPGPYVWRLASRRPDGEQGPWSDSQSFELRPALAAPAGGLSDDGENLQFRWSGRPEDRQELQLARDPAFGDVVATTQLAAAEWTVPNPGPGTYYFRYRSIEPDGFTSEWSEKLRIEIRRDWRYIWLLLLPLVGAL